jgi:integrase
VSDFIKVANVQRVRRKDGRLDLYFRQGDNREGPLKAEDGTQALADEVQAIKDRLAARPAKPKAGTVGRMLREYSGHSPSGIPPSAEFLALARSTQKEYQRLADEMHDDIGDVLLSEVDRGWVRDMRNVWAQRGWKAANDRRQVLKNALQPALEDERIEDDPFARVGKVKRPHDAPIANLPWQSREVSVAIDQAVAKGRVGLARAIALGSYGGFRRGTICAIPRNALIMGADENGRPERRLYWLTEKRKVLADKREDGRLTAVLARTPDKALTIAYNADGQPWKPRQLNQALDRHMAALAKEGLVRAAEDENGDVYCPLTLHGLRHFRGIELAEAGASDAEIMAQLEHATPDTARIYRRQADRKKLAEAGQKRVDAAVDLKAKRAEKAASENNA